MEQLGAKAVLWGLGAVGISGAVFALWGSGGRAGAARMVLYIISPLPPLIAASWGVSMDGALIIVHIETLAASLAVGAGMSLGILRRWGVP